MHRIENTAFGSSAADNTFFLCCKSNSNPPADQPVALPVYQLRYAIRHVDVGNETTLANRG